MSTQFPDALDSFSTLVDNVDLVAASDWNDLADAIVAIETALGINLQSAQNVGDIRIWSASIATIPMGFLHCDGAAVSRSIYEDLFDVIGTIYGVGNGTTTFNIPNIADYFPIGAKQDSSGIAKSNVEGSLNKTGGSLTQPPTTGTANASGAIEGGPNQKLGSHSHTFTPPFIAFALMIKT